MTIGKRHSLNKLGFGFIKGDEYTFRNEHFPSDRQYRPLSRRERKILAANGNRADSWDNIHVSEGFVPELVQDCTFYGMVRIGAQSELYLEYHDLKLPVGIYNSTIISCDIGDDAAISHVHYLSHYVIRNRVLLFNIDEMLTTNHAKFGNGIIKEGEDEDVRIWLEIGNENGGRRVLPFAGLMPGDAYIWSRFRDDGELQSKLKSMTDNLIDNKRGHYGVVGDRSVIKSCRIIKDVTVGECAYIKGANKLKNLTIMSREDAITQIGEGVELVNGIIDVGCRIFYGVKAVRFYLRSNASLKYGARLINSILGDNGTISCCEVLNSLVYPSHEQHHNNSFLCAATVLGQSNIAAGATIGSNHNSRANDGEIIAGRGFWPGLTVSLKHPSRFASFCLIVKGSYPAELDIPLPFSLVSNDDNRNCLVILPGYWFLYNMYALTRNSWKYADRDRHLYDWQSFEYEYLAPDTAEEIISGIEILEKWVAMMVGQGTTPSPDELVLLGRRIFAEGDVPPEVSAPRGVVEAGGRKVIIAKIAEGYHAYRSMLHYYGVKTLLSFMRSQQFSGLLELKKKLGIVRRQGWANIGGQLITEMALKNLRAGIVSGEINTWDKVHKEYGRLSVLYLCEKAKHALACLLWLHGVTTDQLDEATWNEWVGQAGKTNDEIIAKTRNNRQKDYENPFRQMMYTSQEDMDAVLGKLEDNSFIIEMEKESGVFA